MDNFIAYKLIFNCEASTKMILPRNNGPTLRGAFFGALRNNFCLNKSLISCLKCPTAEICPICQLVATVDRENARGAEVPRPFALEPVSSEKTSFEQGEKFNFGITIFGQKLFLFPYAILAIKEMGEIGMGNRKFAPGRYLLKEVMATNPLTNVEKSIYGSNSNMVNMPDVPVTHQEVLSYSKGLSTKRIKLNLITPLRLVTNGALVQALTFQSLIQRLLRRLTDLYNHCSNQQLDLDFPALLNAASKVQVIEDKTRWLDLSSYSSRRQASSPVGGLVGEITFEGQLDVFLPYIVWGQITHVGKDTTKGNGWYQIIGN